MNLLSFEYYLRENHLAERTIRENVKDMERYIQWRESNELLPLPSGGDGGGLYNELLKYVQHLKSQSLSIHTVNIRVNSIRKYYDHLKEEGIIEKNPARHLRIKGQIKKVIENPFTYTELETLYDKYAAYSREKEYHTRNLVLLGLMIWQGLHSGEIEKLKEEHIKLNEGIIYIPSTRRSNNREIKLDARQIILLHKYLEQRNTIAQTPLPWGGVGGGPLFAGSLRNWITHLISELKGINPAIKNAQHIRASVILHWIKMYGKRQVQYMAGHRWISSTQNYEVQELDSLTDQLMKHHPFS
jgi:site-specific recombinase XerD